MDNLPTTLIPTMAKLSLQAGGDIDKVAIVVDVREGNLLSSLPKMLARLRRMPRLNPVLIFLEASHEALVRRFSETRRPHPLAPDRSVTEGIRDEHTRMRPIRELADEIVDTSDMTVHELRQFFMALSRDRGRAKLVMTLVSFGYKYGLPVDADLVFDVRCLPNPHFVPGLRRRTGRDRAVVAFMERDASTREFMDRLGRLPAVRRAVLHRGRQELPDGRHRLHRRTAPFGHDRRAPEARPDGHAGRAGAGPPSRRGPRMTTPAARCRRPAFVVE